MPVTMSFIVLVLWFIGGSPAARAVNQHAVLCAIVAQGVTNALIAISNNVIYRPRPFVEHPTITLLFYRPTDSSFPSNPTAVGFAFATAIFLWNRRAGFLLYALATLYGFSRLYAGVHYPLDIVGGAAFGTGGALLVGAILRPWLEPAMAMVIHIGRRVYLA